MDAFESAEQASLSMALACVVWLGKRDEELARQMRDEVVAENFWSAERWNAAIDQVEAYAERTSPGGVPDYRRWSL